MSIFAAISLALAVVAAQICHGGLFVPALTVPAYGILLVAAFAALLSIGWGRAPSAVPGMVAVAVFVGYVAWRCQYSPDQLLARGEAQLALEGGLAFFTAAIGLRNNRARLTFLVILLAVALAQAVVGFLQYAMEADSLTAPFGWFSESLRLVYEGRFLNRARGLFVNPNQFAWLMTCAALFSVALAVWGKVNAIIWRIVLIYLSLVFVASAVLSGSRGGIVSLLVGLVVLTILSILTVLSGRQRGGLGAVFGAVTLLLLCVGAGAGVYASNWVTQGRVEATFSVTDDRVVLAENAWRAFQVAPLLGNGAGMFRYAARQYRSGGQEGDPIFVHNDWFQALTDYGIVGFGLALIAVFVLLGGALIHLLTFVARNGRRDERLLSNSVAILIGAISVLIAFCVHSFTDFNLHVPANALLAGATLGLITGTVALPERPTWPARLRDLSLRGLGAALLLAVAAAAGWLWWKNARSDYDALVAQNALINGESISALPVIDRGLKLTPDNVELLLARGQAKYEYLSAARTQGGDVLKDLTPPKLRRLFEESAEAFTRAAQAQPLERSTKMKLSSTLNELKAPAAARNQLVQAISLDPFHVLAYSAYAESFYEEGNLPRAARILEIAATLPGWRDASDRLWEIREEMAPPPDEETTEESTPEP